VFLPTPRFCRKQKRGTQKGDCGREFAAFVPDCRLTPAVRLLFKGQAAFEPVRLWPLCPRTNVMPELSRFYGIIIRMFSEPSERHRAPHFHAYHGEHAAVFSISPVALVTGLLPRREQRLVEAWAEIHEEELLAGWQLVEQGRKPAPITPLQ